MFEKSGVMCILQTQSVTLFFCILIIFMNQKVGIHMTKGSYTSWLTYIEKNKLKIEKIAKY